MSDITCFVPVARTVGLSFLWLATLLQYVGKTWHGLCKCASEVGTVWFKFVGFRGYRSGRLCVSFLARTRKAKDIMARYS